MSISLINEDPIDSALGTPLAQRLFRLFSIWQTLTYKELLNKSDISESQISVLLQRFVDTNLINKISKGNYSIQSTLFVSQLSQAYIDRSKELINNMIFKIHQELKMDNFTIASQIYEHLELFYLPLLEKYFQKQLSGLIHQFME